MTGQSDESVVFKWNVPVDDQWHPIGSGPVVLVGCQRGPGVIQVWTREGGGPGGVQGARAFGTGQPVPGDAEHVGSVSHHDSGLVWHVFTTPGNPTLNSPTPPGQTR